MSPGRDSAGRGRVARAIFVLAAVSACLGAAVAVARGGGNAGLADQVRVGPSPSGGAGSPRSENPPPRPSFIEGPEATSVLSETRFRFHIPPKPSRSDSGATAPAPGPGKPRRRFQCRYDGGDWFACGSPYRLETVPPGNHVLSVRASSRSGAQGPAASYAWRQIDPLPISIAVRDAGEALYPGFPPQPLDVTVTNPNDVPVEVVRLTAGLASAPPSCPAENFRLTPSTASLDSPLPVPAGGSVRLPSGAVSAPSIEMLNLPVNQDACGDAELDLVFEAEARG
jgi:hypothetical protein